jgi:DNA-binding NtrC family response regulator
LLEAGESELSDAAELADTAELQDTVDLAEGMGLAERAGLAEQGELAERVELADFGGRSEAANTALPPGGIDLKDHLSGIEMGLIRKALEEADGTVAEAARLLGMRRTTLVEKLRKYRLSA